MVRAFASFQRCTWIQLAKNLARKNLLLSFSTISINVAWTQQILCCAFIRQELPVVAGLLLSGTASWILHHWIRGSYSSAATIQRFHDKSSSWILSSSWVHDLMSPCHCHWMRTVPPQKGNALPRCARTANLLDADRAVLFFAVRIAKALWRNLRSQPVETAYNLSFSVVWNFLQLNCQKFKIFRVCFITTSCSHLYFYMYNVHVRYPSAANMPHKFHIKLIYELSFAFSVKIPF